MFIQVITGKTSDRDGLRRQFDRWQQELQGGATGYLGSTGGVTDDGGVFMAARFESEEAARRNSAREEQGTWWAETEKFLENATFQDSAEVHSWEAVARTTPGSFRSCGAGSSTRRRRRS
jgi:hypothetical protein